MLCLKYRSASFQNFLALLLIGVGPTMTQAQDFRVQNFSTGRNPVSLEITPFVPAPNSSNALALAAVTNSGDDTVSILEVVMDAVSGKLSLVQRGSLSSIPNAYGISFCNRPPGFPSGEGIVILVTSPSTDSVYIFNASNLRLLTTVRVGDEPYSVACSSRDAFISNYVERSLSVIDLASFNEKARVLRVPGSKAPRSVYAGLNNIYVAGTESDIVTVIDSSFGIATWLSYPRPIAVQERVGTIGVGPTIRGVVRELFLASEAEIGLANYGPPQEYSFKESYPFFPALSDMDLGYSRFFFPSKAGELLVTSSDFGFAGKISELSNVSAVRSLPFFFNSESYFVLALNRLGNVLSLAQPISYGTFPRAFSMVNGASFSGSGVAPGSLTSLFFETGASQNVYATSLPLPTSLGGVSLRVGGQFVRDPNTASWVLPPAGTVAATLLFVGPTQVNFQLPPGIAPGETVPAELRRPDGTTLLSALVVPASQPGIFSVAMNGRGPGVVINENQRQNWFDNPARRGSIVNIYATGQGETSPALPPGTPAPASGVPLIYTSQQPSVRVGDRLARVLFSGLAPGFVGLWQLNAEVPPDAPVGLAVPLTITLNEQLSNTVTVAID